VIVSRQLVVSVLALGVSCLAGSSAPAAEAAQQENTATGTPPTAASALDERLQLRWSSAEPSGAGAAVELQGVEPSTVAALAKAPRASELCAKLLIVRVAGAERVADTPPLLGSYRVDGSIIKFQPRFPLERGIVYRAEVDPAALERLAELLGVSGKSAGSDRPKRLVRALVAEFSPSGGQSPARPATTVTQIYPSADILPENLFRFYIHFSAPMGRGEAYRRIKLLDASGKPVTAAFLELDEELWSNDGTRFTLYFDPGRVKQGLKPREELGPILVAGKTYSLLIDRAWRDASGEPLATDFKKQFRTGPANLASPDPKSWKVSAPVAGAVEPLTIRFPESLDRALLDRLISVRDAGGNKVFGRIEIGEHETAWRFSPERPWRAGDYQIVVGSELEDVAGNSVAQPFEVDVVHPISPRIVRDTVILPFRVDPISHR
jgi:hypothetical protein